MPRPFYQSLDTMNRADQLDFDASVENGIADLHFPQILEQGIQGLKDLYAQATTPPSTVQPRPEYGTPAPLPIVQSPTPQMMAMPTVRPEEEDPEYVPPQGPASPAPSGPLAATGGVSVGSGGGVDASPITGTSTKAQQQALAYQAARAAGKDDEAAKILVAVTETEGGLEGAVGDNGQSRGGYQFHAQGEMPGFVAWLRAQGIQGDPNQLVNDIRLTTRYAAEGYLGQAIERGRQLGLTGAKLATFVQQTGQRSVDPARTGANYERLFGTGQGAPQTPTSPSGAPSPMPQASAQPATQFAAGEYTPNQINAATAEGLDYETALAVCGPAAAIAFARKTGRNPTMQEAVNLARQVGWTPGAGMAGPASEQQLLQRMGVPARLQDGAPDWSAVATDVQRGNPVTISTPGHYFVAERYDPQSGAFDFGQSALVLKASGGRRWFKPEEIASLGMGSPRATLFIDNPESPTPSIAASGDARQSQTNPSPPPSGDPAPSTEPPPWAGQEPTSQDQGPLMLRQGLTDGQSSPPVRDDYASEPNPSMQSGFTSPPVRDDYRNDPTQPYSPDQGPHESGYTLPSQADLGVSGAVQASGQGVDAPNQDAIDRASVAGLQPGETLTTPPQPITSTPSPDDLGNFARATAGNVQELPQNIASLPAAHQQAVDETAHEIVQTFRDAGQTVNDGNVTRGVLQGLWGALEVVNSPFAVIGKDIDHLLPEYQNDYVSPGTIVTNATLPRDAVQLAQGAGKLLAAGIKVTPKVIEALRSGETVENILIRAAQAVDTGIDRASEAVRTGRETAARAAEQPGMVAPGIFGTAPEFSPPGMRPRVVPPDVADQLDFPVRIPDDPRFRSAVEAAGGSIDPERGVDLGLTRAQAPEAAGGVATRGGVFYEAIPEGGKSSYVRSANDAKGVGGTEALPRTPTRYRSPLVLEDAPGSGSGFDDGMRRLLEPQTEAAKQAAKQAWDEAVQTYEAATEKYGSNLDELRARRDAIPVGDDTFEVYDRSGNLVFNGKSRAEAIDWAVRNGMPSPDIARAPAPRNQAWLDADAALQEVFRARYRLKEARTAVQRAERGVDVPTSHVIDEAIHEARRAGPEGSPARSQALKDLVTRYGGDPSVIDDLLKIRGADHSESAWAIKENIIAAQARKAGYDGIVTVQHKEPNQNEIWNHPKVAEARAAREVVSQEFGTLQNQLLDIRQSLADRGITGSEATQHPEYRSLADRASALSTEYNRLNTVVYEAEQAARREMGNPKITEIQDVREARNPTPGTENPLLAELWDKHEQAKQAYLDAQNYYRTVANDPVKRPIAESEVVTTRSRMQRAWQDYDKAERREPQYVGQPGYTLREDLPRRAMASETAYGGLGVTPGTRRAYHGTASDFPRVDPNRLDDNALFGPGYYLTSDPRVAGGYSTERATGMQRRAAIEDELGQFRLIAMDPSSTHRQVGLARKNIPQLEKMLADLPPVESGPNIRALDIPQDLNLLDIDAAAAPEIPTRVANTLREYFGNSSADEFLAMVTDDGQRTPTGEQIFSALRTALSEPVVSGGKVHTPSQSTVARTANEILAEAGFDGVTHKGGQRVPLLDAGGSPIEHDVTVVFPHALPRVRNALSGEYGGATLGVLPSTGRPDRLAGINNMLSQGIASTISGGVGAAANQQLNPDDPNAGLKGFAAGALAPLAITKGVRAGLRLAGKDAEGASGALASFGTAPRPSGLGNVPPSQINQGMLPGMEAPPPAPIGQVAGDLQIPDSLNTPQVQRALTGAQRRAELMQQRGLTTPSAWDWLKQAGYAGIYGPATLVNSAVGGAQELLLGQPKEFARALASGRPGAYGAQVRAQVQAAPEGLAGLGRVLFGADSEAAARASGGSQGTANLSDRVVNPVGHFVARLLERPGEILTEAPDAVFRPMFQAQGMQREAQAIAAEAGLRGPQATARAAELMQEAEALRTNPDTAVASDTAHRIVEAGKAYADELGYKGDPGGFGKWLSQTARRDDAVGFLASLLVPFPSMAARMSRAAARSTPGVGLLPAVRRGQNTAFDVAYDQALGTAVAAGVAGWAFNGGITGSGPADKEKRQMMIDQGWQPNSTLVGGYYIPNRVFQKFQPILDTAGEIHDALAYGKKDQKTNELVADLAKRASRIAVDQTGLSGLADLHDMFTQGFDSQFPGWSARTAIRYFPYSGVIRAAATATDSANRRPDRWADVGFGQALGEQAEMAVSGLRQNVPAAQDTLGREAKNPQYGLGAIIPRVTTQKNDPIIQLFQDAGVDISAPGKEMTVGRVSGVPLKPEEQRRWNTHRGQFIQEYADAFTDNPEFMALPPLLKQRYLTKFLGQAATYADKMVQSDMNGDDLVNRATEAAQKKAS